MDTSQATKLFANNWFLRHEERPALTAAEERFIAAAMGPDPERWKGAPDLQEMQRLLAAEPGVLERIGGHLLQVLIGMEGCGPAVTFLLDRGVPLEIDESAYNVLHEAAWGGMDDTLRAVFESGRRTPPASRWRSPTWAGRTTSPSCTGRPGAGTPSAPAC